MKAAVQHGKLHHNTPGWVLPGARFHIRLRLEGPQRPLTEPALGRALLDSVRFYHAQGRWFAWLVVLMPDHLHAVLTFPPQASMGDTVGDWKRYQQRTLGLNWQNNFFDHRLRSDDECVEKCSYIRMNPVRQGLCTAPEDWPWITEPWKKD